MKLHKHHSEGSLKSVHSEYGSKRHSQGSMKTVNDDRASKRYSDCSMKSINGECVTIPIEQYERLLKAQQVSNVT